LLATLHLDSLLQSLGRFSEKLTILGAPTHEATASPLAVPGSGGPALIFHRLWQACSIDRVLPALLKGRRFEFPIERAVFLTVPHRLFAPGRDRAAGKRQGRPRHPRRRRSGLAPSLYRAMAWLGEVLPHDRQDGATPFAPRTNKDLIKLI